MDCTPTTPPLDPAADEAWHHPLLRDLAELGFELAREVQQQALRQARCDTAAPAAPRAGLLFTRVARTVRQTVALDARLAERRRDAATGSAAAQSRRDATLARRKRHARTEIRRQFEHAVQADERVRGDCERLLADLHERLDDDDIDAMLDTTPIGEIVVALCREFAIRPDLSDWTDEDLDRAIERTNPDPPAHADPPLDVADARR